MDRQKNRKDWLVFVLFTAVFMNGFEAAGYQASLAAIGKEYALNEVGMGLLASVQLAAGMIAPLIFGPLADRVGKKRMLLIFLPAELAAALSLVLGRQYGIITLGIFLIGLSVNTVHYIVLAVTADLFPATGGRKIGWLTAFYSLGAVIAPLICGSYLQRGYSWKILFAILGAAAVFLTAGIAVSEFTPRETVQAAGGTGTGSAGRWILSGMLMLCAVMFVYVGFENGFAFFVTPYLRDVLHTDYAYIALSMFWLAMIPSRILSGYFSRWNRQILAAATTGAAVSALAVGVTGAGTAGILLCLPLGFFCGAVYTSVLTRSLDFAGGRTATATGMITAATGLGGTVVTALTGVVSQQLGLRKAVLALAGLVAVDIVLSLLLLKYKNK